MSPQGYFHNFKLLYFHNYDTYLNETNINLKKEKKRDKVSLRICASKDTDVLLSQWS
jgi:hypothetical protein